MTLSSSGKFTGSPNQFKILKISFLNYKINFILIKRILFLIKHYEHEQRRTKKVSKTKIKRYKNFKRLQKSV